MRQLSPAGQQIIADLAQRHGFTTDATASMLDAVIDGNGSMAQFNHPEFSGSGQWMRGGMIMLSDMFNNYLKGRIDSLCNELAALVANQPDLIATGSFQSQRQGGQQQSNFSGGPQPQGGFGPASLFVPPAGNSGPWWPADLGRPNSTGAQNNVRYAYFADARRLAIDIDGQITVYDTLDHQIGGFSQQQSYGGSLSFSSQYGLIDVASLPIRAPGGFAPTAPAPEMTPPSSFAATPPNTAELDVFATIEKLAALREKGILSDQEFTAKKTELLARL